MPKTHSSLKRLVLKLGVTSLFLTAPLGKVHADDLFKVAAKNELTSEVLRAGNSNLEKLVKELLRTEGTFQALADSPYFAALNYAGVANAITFNVNTDGMVARLDLPSIKFNKRFTGRNRDEVEDKISDFLKKDGSDVLARFLKSMASQSLVAVTDGNPNSTTALSASNAYASSMDTAFTNEEKDAAENASASSFGASFSGSIGSIDADGIKGSIYQFPIRTRYQINQRVGVNLDIPLSYIEIEGAEIYGAGVNLAVPIQIVPASKKSPWHWQVTPFVAFDASASEDFGAGGMLLSGGLNSVVSYDFGPVILSMGNYFSAHEGIPFSYDEYNVDPGVSQQILKNGLKLDVPLGKRWIVDVYAIHTKFLADAAVEQYFTVGGSVGYRVANSGGYIRLGLYADVGDNYSSPHAFLGTGWKF